MSYCWESIRKCQRFIFRLNVCGFTSTFTFQVFRHEFKVKRALFEFCNSTKKIHSGNAWQLQFSTLFFFAQKKYIYVFIGKGDEKFVFGTRNDEWIWHDNHWNVRQRYSNIYLLCDHLKRIKSWTLSYTATGYAIKSVAKRRRKKKLFHQSARIDCYIVTYCELFRQITLKSDLACVLVFCLHRR